MKGTSVTILFDGDSETAHLILTLLRGSDNLSILFLSFFFFSFISFPRPLPHLPSLLTAYLGLCTPEWRESCSAKCHAVMETGSHGCPLPVPESFFILSLVTPENNYFKDQSRCLAFQFISLPPFFCQARQWCQKSNQACWQDCLPRVFSLSTARHSNVPWLQTLSSSSLN